MQCERCRSEAQTKVNTRISAGSALCLPCAMVVLADRQCDFIPQPPQPAGVIDDANRQRAAAMAHAVERGWANEPATTPLLVISRKKPLHAFFSVQRFEEVGSTPQGGSSYMNVYRNSDGSHIFANIISENEDHGQPFDDVRYVGEVVEFVRQIEYHEFLRLLPSLNL